MESNNNNNHKTTAIFVAGDKSTVGKSTVCVGLFGALLAAGKYKASEMAYIKPATQCVGVQLVSKYCYKAGIACRGIGPLVFYTGFTRECINGEGPSPDQLLTTIQQAVAKIAEGKKFVLVDGVGYPSVGSIVGVSNAHVAKRLGCKVLLVGKHGVGDAIDSFNLNCCWFEKFGVDVLGCIFNKVEEPYEDTKHHVMKWFAQTFPEEGERSGIIRKRAYGFIPQSEELSDHRGAEEDKKRESCQLETPLTLQMSEEEEQRCERIVQQFMEHVDLESLLQDIQNSSALSV